MKTASKLQMALNRLTRIDGRYDADNDTAPGMPVVSFADYELSQALQHLILHVHELEKRIEELEATK